METSNNTFLKCLSCGKWRGFPTSLMKDVGAGDFYCNKLPGGVTCATSKGGELALLAGLVEEDAEAAAAPPPPLSHTVVKEMLRGRALDLVQRAGFDGFDKLVGSPVEVRGKDDIHSVFNATITSYDPEMDRYLVRLNDTGEERYHTLTEGLTAFSMSNGNTNSARLQCRAAALWSGIADGSMYLPVAIQLNPFKHGRLAQAPCDCCRGTSSLKWTLVDAERDPKMAPEIPASEPSDQAVLCSTCHFAYLKEGTLRPLEAMEERRRAPAKVLKPDEQEAVMLLAGAAETARVAATVVRSASGSEDGVVVEPVGSGSEGGEAVEAAARRSRSEDSGLAGRFGGPTAAAAAAAPAAGGARRRKASKPHRADDAGAPVARDGGEEEEVDEKADKSKGQGLFKSVKDFELNNDGRNKRFHKLMAKLGTEGVPIHDMGTDLNEEGVRRSRRPPKTKKDELFIDTDEAVDHSRHGTYPTRRETAGDIDRRRRRSPDSDDENLYQRRYASRPTGRAARADSPDYNRGGYGRGSARARGMDDRPSQQLVGMLPIPNGAKKPRTGGYGAHRGALEVEPPSQMGYDSRARQVYVSAGPGQPPQQVAMGQDGQAYYMQQGMPGMPGMAYMAAPGQQQAAYMAAGQNPQVAAAYRQGQPMMVAYGQNPAAQAYAQASASQQAAMYQQVAQAQAQQLQQYQQLQLQAQYLQQQQQLAQAQAQQMAQMQGGQVPPAAGWPAGYSMGNGMMGYQ